MRATLHSSRWLSGDVREIVLSPHGYLGYRPGQYVGIARPGGERRCYSMARAPSGDRRIALHVRRWPGGSFSDRVMNEVRIGDEFDITGPLGAFSFPQGSGPVVMLATGTGIAPFLAMLEAFLPEQASRSVSLYWGVRAADDLYARDTLKDWVARFPSFRFVPVLSTLGKEYVQDKAAREMQDPASTHVLACGHGRMIADAHARLVTGTPNPVADFVADEFEPAAAQGNDDRSACAEQGSITPRIVGLLVDGKALSARIGESLLDALSSAGLPIMSVCGGKASCGTCIVEFDPDWVERVPSCLRAERNLLACLPDVGPLSRLACQIRITREIDGLAIKLLSK
ncbi:CDP-4-dehydro-6-deoxyglucose reductase [Paraburkholderia sp. GAS41]|jgi:CDP-4-dehydro-6-deoxyglucose reductase|uniref:flavin reductase family protein n=1 Tax=Paraburkholderia sp. GAS41 TaxID=3035134 RepID=UPI003D1FB9CC